MKDTRIDELTSVVDLREAYPVMNQLRPVRKAEFIRLAEEMWTSEDYRLFALRNDTDDQIRALAGLTAGTTLYHGKHARVHDFTVDKPHRGDGCGSQLLAWIEDWADERDCARIELASGLWREDAHDFYEQNGMERYCYTFKSELSADSPY